MEKKNTAAAVASKAVPVKATVPAFGVAAGASTDAGRGKIPLGWDPYEEDEYIRLENPFNTSLVDPWAEEQSSDVGTDLESVETKARQVLRRLQSSQYDAYFANGIYRCPFCTTRLGATDFNRVVTHAEKVSFYNPKVGETVNDNAFYAKHKAFGIHLRKLQQVAITEGRMSPIKPKEPKIKGQGSKKWRKRQREESKARRW